MIHSDASIRCIAMNYHLARYSGKISHAIYQVMNTLATYFRSHLGISCRVCSRMTSTARSSGCNDRSGATEHTLQSEWGGAFAYSNLGLPGARFSGPHLGQETQACLARTFHETIVVGGLQSVLPSTTIPSVLPSTAMAKNRTCSSPGGVGIATLQSNGLLLVRPSTIPRNSDQDTKPEMPSR